ncbi:MAG: hypothetical protein GEV04_25625, partial [Actinophytocola sp.]|nr:hypothetical protein [Actinophytocola sp.]
MARMVSRRTLLGATAGSLVTGAACLGLIEAAVLPGRAPLRRTLGMDGPDTPLPDTEGGPSVAGEFGSAARGGKTVRWRAAYPPGMVASAQLPVVIALHAEDGDHRFPFDTLGADRYLAEVDPDDQPHLYPCRSLLDAG